MYEAIPDPYCYSGTSVLRNKLNIRDAALLEQFEAAGFLRRSIEPLPAGQFDPPHYRAVHRHLFRDIYVWAGRYRTVRISKNGSAFCYPENIRSQMDELFRRLRGQRFLTSLSREDFARSAATFLATLNAIHPFREGNGRSQLSFVKVLASRAGHPLDFARLQEAPFLAAMIHSFAEDEEPLAAQLFDLAQ